MRKRMTISLSEEVYDGLYRTIGKRRMSKFIEDLLKPHVLGSALENGYRAMAQDQAREADASELKFNSDLRAATTAPRFPRRAHSTPPHNVRARAGLAARRD